MLAQTNSLCLSSGIFFSVGIQDYSELLVQNCHKSSCQYLWHHQAVTTMLFKRSTWALHFVHWKVLIPQHSQITWFHSCQPASSKTYFNKEVPQDIWSKNGNDFDTSSTSKRVGWQYTLKKKKRLCKKIKSPGKLWVLSIKISMLLREKHIMKLSFHANWFLSVCVMWILH